MIVETEAINVQVTEVEAINVLITEGTISYLAAQIIDGGIWP